MDGVDGLTSEVDGVDRLEGEVGVDVGCDTHHQLGDICWLRTELDQEIDLQVGDVYRSVYTRQRRPAVVCLCGGEA